VVNVPGRGEVFYRHHQGPPGAPLLLLLHGWAASADLQWFTAYRELGERYSFVAVDHRGHGRGLRSLERFTLEAAADDAAGLLDALGLGPVIAAGYSMGGPIALHLWARHHARVAGLVLEATALEWRAQRRERMRWRFIGLLEIALRSRLMRRAGLRMLARQVGLQPGMDEWLPWVGAEMARGDPGAIADAGRALGRYDAREFAKGVDVPASLVLTLDDHAVQPSKQRALASAVNADVHELPGDHLVFFTNGDDFSSVTRKAVDAVAARIGTS
jgi:pimeloyl-ACP methyl ester carboxylesterase